MGEMLESARKKARTKECSTTTGSSGKLCGEQVTKILNSLSNLYIKFPELKFIIDFENLQESVETTVVKYVEEKETKKRKDLLHMNYRQEISPLYSLPDETLNKCLSYVGKGYYGLVGLASKKLNKAYKAEFGNETAFLEMATSVKLASHCIDELCKSLVEKDDMFKAAAVNGNLDILRYADLNGYDLFPLVEMEYISIYDGINETGMYENEEYYNKVDVTKIVERGHLHVLKYLYEELNFYLGLQRYCIPAIKYGKLDILKWLQGIGCVEKNPLHTESDFCRTAILSGNLEVLKWLLQNGYEIKESIYNPILATAIRSKSLEMIQHCFDLGHNWLYGDDEVKFAINKTKSVEVFRLMHELGYHLNERSIQDWCVFYDNMDFADSFETIKFLRSISLPWDDKIIKNILELGTLEMIQYAHENGYIWTSRGEEYNHLLYRYMFSPEKFEYLIENGCTLDYDNISKDFLVRKKDFTILDCFIGKNSKFDNELYKYILTHHDNPQLSWFEVAWSEGMSYISENGKDVQNFKSIEDVFHTSPYINRIKSFHRLGLPWCLDSSKNTHLLSKIACHTDLEDVKWAYENGCKGGDLVQYVAEEWEKDGIRRRGPWKENQAFFEENGMFDECFLEKVGIMKLNTKNVQEIGDAHLESIDSWFQMDFSNLKRLLDFGYTFRSKSERESVSKIAFEKCCERSYEKEKEPNRKRHQVLHG